MIDRYALLDDAVDALAWMYSTGGPGWPAIGDPLRSIGVWRFGYEAVEGIPGRYELYLVDDEPAGGPDYVGRRRLWLLGIRERDTMLGELLGIPPAYAAGFDRGYIFSYDARYPRRRGELVYETEYVDGLFDAVALEARLRAARLITGGI